MNHIDFHQGYDEHSWYPRQALGVPLGSSFSSAYAAVSSKGAFRLKVMTFQAQSTFCIFFLGIFGWPYSQLNMLNMYWLAGQSSETAWAALWCNVYTYTQYHPACTYLPNLDIFWSIKLCLASCVKKVLEFSPLCSVQHALLYKHITECLRYLQPLSTWPNEWSSACRVHYPSTLNIRVYRGFLSCSPAFIKFITESSAKTTEDIACKMHNNCSRVEHGETHRQYQKINVFFSTKTRCQRCQQTNPTTLGKDIDYDMIHII